MDFLMEYPVEDESGKIIYKTARYSAELEDAVAKIYKVVNSDKELIIDQPWNPLNDGTRIDWNSIEEVIEWFKANYNV